MATYTPNLNLKKPATTDLVSIADINGNMDTLDTAVAGKLDKTAAAAKAKGLIYLEPTVTTTKVLWSATTPDISSYYDGLMVVVRCPEATATGLALKINSLAAPTIVFNATSGISTRYAEDSIVIMTYKTIDGTPYWSIMDYDANTNTQVRQYQTTSNVNYPILTRYNITDKAGTYEQAYARFDPDVTINPSTGGIYAKKFFANGVELTGGGAKIHSNLSASSWTSDSTYAGFGYRCALAITGVTANDVAEVVFNQTEAASGNYASVCETYAGGVYIYSSVNTAITIPTVLIHKG